MLKAILRGHRYLAFHSYLWQKYTGSAIPEIAGVIQMAGLIFLHFFILANLTHALIGLWIPPMGFGPWGGVAFMLLLVVTEYWCLMAKGRFDKIKREFESQSEISIRRGRKVVLIYGFGSLFLAVLIPVLFSLRS